MFRVAIGRRLRLAVGVAAVAAAIVPAAAYAWFQTYAANTYFNPDGIALSSFNQSLNYNDMSWDPPYDPGGQADRTTGR